MPDLASNPVLADLRNRIERLEQGPTCDRAGASLRRETDRRGPAQRRACPRRSVRGGNGAIDGAAAALLAAETIRRWTQRFGPAYAASLRRQRPRPLRSLASGRSLCEDPRQNPVSVEGGTYEGEVLDTLVQTRRDKRAALKLLRKLLKKQGYVPESIVTDRLGSSGAALRSLGLETRHVQGGRSNSRAEVFPPTDPTTGTDEQRLQVARLGAKVPLHPRRRLQPVQPPATPDLTPNASSLESRRKRGMAEIVAA